MRDFSIIYGVASAGEVVKTVLVHGHEVDVTEYDKRYGSQRRYRLNLAERF